MVQIKEISDSGINGKLLRFGGISEYEKIYCVFARD